MTSVESKGGTRKKDITESKPVNNMKEFGGGSREQFREWDRKLTEVMQQLRPRARSILREIDTADKDYWNQATHADVFCDSLDLQEMYDTLNEDIWWVLSTSLTNSLNDCLFAAQIAFL